MLQKEASNDELVPAVNSRLKDKENKPARKRLKTDDAEAAMDVDAEAPRLEPPSASRAMSPPTAALPSFPLPKLPHAPSKSVLALQGLDKGLVHAELVDHARVLPIPSGAADHGGTELSERTRCRLLELGITELFAGACASG